MKHKIITKEMVKEMKTLTKQKLSEREIAKKLKCTRNQVHYWLNK